VTSKIVFVVVKSFLLISESIALELFTISTSIDCSRLFTSAQIIVTQFIDLIKL